MTTSEKVAYLKGLAEGMGMENAGQGKLMNVIIDILEDLSLDLADTRGAVEELNDGLDEMGDDLSALEDEFYDSVYGEFDPAEIDGDHRRCNTILEGYEEKLHLVEKFVAIRGQVQRIHELARKLKSEEIVRIAGEVLEEL